MYDFFLSEGRGRVIFIWKNVEFFFKVYQIGFSSSTETTKINIRIGQIVLKYYY